MRGRPKGSTDYKLVLSEKQTIAESFLTLARQGERCYQDPQSKYISTRNIARWPFPIQPDDWFEHFAIESKPARIKCGVDQFELLVRIFPRMIISRRDFKIAWFRVGGMGWRTIRHIDGRDPALLRAVYLSILDDIYREIKDENIMQYS